MARNDYELEITEFHAALRNRTAIPGDSFRQPEFQVVRYANYLAIDDKSAVTAIDSRAVQPFIARYFLKDHVFFNFCKRTLFMRWEGGAFKQVPVGSVIIGASFESSLDIKRTLGHEVAAVAIFVQRDHLINHYGLSVEKLPQQCEDVFYGRPNSRFRFDIELSSRSWLILDAIFSCRMEEPLKSIYLRAKYQELLVEAIDLLNRREDVPLVESIPKARRERHMIEAAALIYRRDLKNAPSLRELARNFGMNSVTMTDGFRDLFGIGPKEYAIRARLDWAKEQLAVGACSIEEAAKAIGYASPRQFAKAYGEQFGTLLSPRHSAGFSFTESILSWSPLEPPGLLS